VRAMFDGHETLCAAGATIHFWAFASFARCDGGIIAAAARPSADNNNGTIVYRCDALECVDVTPFFTVPRDGVDGVEVLPLPPLVTTVVSATLQPGHKTLVVNLLQQPNDGACYVVPRVAASPEAALAAKAAATAASAAACAAAASSATPEQLMERGAAAFSAEKFAEAAAIYTQVIDLCRAAAAASASVDNSDFLKRALLNRSGAFCLLGEHERALSDAQELCFKSHSHLAKAWQRCAAAYEGLKRYGEAAQAYRMAAKVSDRKGAAEPLVYMQSASEMYALAAERSAVVAAKAPSALDENADADGVAPLAFALQRLGLSEEDIVQDGWTALMGMPRAVLVDILTSSPAFAPAAAHVAVGEHATLDVLKVKPSSEASVEIWCRVVAWFSAEAVGQRVLGVPAVGDALVAVVHPEMSTHACTDWCFAVGLLARGSESQLFGTAALRDALVAVRANANGSAEACEWWCAAAFALAAQSNGQQLLGTAAVRDALMAAWPQVETPRACGLWFAAVATLAKQHDANARLFGTTAVRDALIALHPLAMRGAPLDGCAWWCAAISNISCQTSAANARMLGTAAVRDAIVAVHRHAMSNPFTVTLWCQAIAELVTASELDANKRLLGTPEIRDALLALRPHATSVDACRWWCCAVDRITTSNAANQQLFGTAAVRDAFVALHRHATSEHACESWCAAISKMARDSEANRRLFGTPAVRDALLALRPQVTTASACQAWTTMIVNLPANNAANAHLFSTAEVRDALFAVYPQATSDFACGSWCAAVSGLGGAASVPGAVITHLFGTAQLRDALVALRPHVASAYSCQWWCTTICIVTIRVSQSAATAQQQQLFLTAAIRDGLVALQPFATSVEACRWWCGVIRCLSHKPALVARVAAVRDAYAALKRVAATDPEVNMIWVQTGMMLL
jgi:hypothetical protein